MTILDLSQEVLIVAATEKKHKQLVLNLTQFYQHDMSIFFDHSAENLPTLKGLYDPLPYFDQYWTAKDRFPYLIFFRERPVGFALVNKVGTDSSVDWNMAEFFIIKNCRKFGIGGYAAKQIIDKFSGIWEIAVIPDNQSAYLFWSHVSEHVFPNQKVSAELKTIENPKPHSMHVLKISSAKSK